MFPRVIKALTIFLLLSSIAACAFLGYRHIQLKDKQEALHKELSQANQVIDALKTKYAQEKARTGGLIRDKALLEGRIREDQLEIARLENEKESAIAELASLKTSNSNDVLALEKKLARLSEERDRLKSIHAETIQKYNDTAEKLKEREKAIGSLEGDKRALQVETRQMQQQNERMRGHNERLCQLAEELIEKYKNKRVSDTMLENEPFTQIKKVELEQLIQEYLDRVDKENLENSF